MLNRLTANLQSQTWLRWLSALVVLSLSAMLAYRGGRLGQLVLLGIPATGVALVFLRWPPLGLAALIAASLLVPFSLGTGTQTGLNITVLLLSALVGLWLFDMFARQRRITLHPSRPILPLLGLAGAAVLAFIVGQLPWFTIAGAPLRSQLGGLAIFLLSVGAFLLAAHQMDDLRWLQVLTWLLLALGGLYVAGQLLPGLGTLTSRLFQQGSTGSVFWVWLVALSFSQAVFNQQLNIRWRLALGGLVLAAFYVGLFQGTAWASGWLPPLVSVVVILLVGMPRLGLLATLAGGIVGVINSQKVINLVMLGDQQYSIITRREAWGIIAQIVKVNPLLGLGPANYYWYTPLYPILGWYVVFNSHNQYVDLIAQTGILGLVFFLWFVWEVGRLGWRLKEQVQKGGFEQAYVYGALGGLAGMLVAGMLGDWVLPFVYNIGLTGFRASVLGWLFLGGLVVVEQVTRRKS